MKPAVSVYKKMSPLLSVTHMANSIEFYTEKLGFSVEFRYEDFYAGISKDGLSIHLKSGSKLTGGEKEKDDVQVIILVENIEGLYEEISHKKIEIVQTIRDMPYGKEFYIADLDGNQLAFIEN